MSAHTHISLMSKFAEAILILQCLIWLIFAKYWFIDGVGVNTASQMNIFFASSVSCTCFICQIY